MLTNQEITFENMSTRFGEIAAYEYLEQIERATYMRPQYSIDPEVRLSNAIRVQDGMHNAAEQLAV